MINTITKMLPHQQKAFEKLKGLKIGALYMEQGTGKTRTTIELIKYRLEKDKIDKVLWLCPCNTKQNLKNEIIKHTDDEYDDLIKICGIETLSQSDRTMDKMEELVRNNRVFIIVDESLLIKNIKSKRSQRIIYLSTFCQYRVLLNGTPISRYESDLFAQWFMLDWRIMGYRSYYSFAANHLERDYKRRSGRVVRCLNVDYLTDKISPYTYQVSKNECIELPPKKYEYKCFEMSKQQQEEYLSAFDKYMPTEEGFGRKGVYRFFTALSQVLSGMYVYSIKDEKGEEHIKTKKMYENPCDNPRIQALLNIIKKEKTIIFVRYTHEIEDIIKVLENEFGVGCCVRFDGSVSYKQRAINMNEFEHNNNVLFFVANKSCASYGLNLQFCNKMIFYNNDWNYGTRGQAEDRVHRIGQDKEVKIYDIVCLRSMDETIQKCLKKKELLLEEINKYVKEKNYEDLKALLQEISQIKEQENNLDI